MERKQRIVTNRKIQAFRSYLIQGEKSPNTIEKYLRDIRKFQKFADGKRVTRKMLLAYKSELETCGKYKISSINSFLTVLNRFCKAVGWDDLSVKTIRMHRNVFETEERELTMTEYSMLVDAAMDARREQIALIMQTIASTGIRIGELEYICVESLSNGVADVYNKGKMRRVFLPSALVKVLLAYVRKNRIRSGSIFCDKKNQPVERKEIWKKMKRVARLAGVPESKVFPHNLRHLFAKEFYRQTRDIIKLADVLGHTNVNTTRIYTRTTGREHKQQLDSMHMVIQGSVGLPKYEFYER